MQQHPTYDPQKAPLLGADIQQHHHGNNKARRIETYICLGSALVVMVGLALSMVLTVVSFEVWYSAHPGMDMNMALPVHIMKNSTLSSKVESARNRLLVARNFNRLDATILFPAVNNYTKNRGGGGGSDHDHNHMMMMMEDELVGDMDMTKEHWWWGAYNPNALAYPASCVKLAYLLAAVDWCKNKSLTPDCLDQAVQPMISVSSNEMTGVVVDMITGAPNKNITNSSNHDFHHWIDARRYTQRLLDKFQLLGNQTVLHKTYPTNSGSGPVLAEGLARSVYGSNMMSSNDTAFLMMYIIRGLIEPQATSYMMQQLRHEPRASYSSFGYGLPPGSLILTKLGAAYDTLEEVAYIVLPNGKEFILSAFSNGLEFNGGSMDVSNLGMFAEYIIEETGLDVNITKLKLSTSAPEAKVVGNWLQTTSKEMFGDHFLYITCDTANAASASVQWTLNITTPGLYEVTTWHVGGQNHGSASFKVMSSSGQDVTTVSQRYYGGRWVFIGNFYFDGINPASVAVSCANADSSVIVANAIKVVKWPDTGSVSGLSPWFAPQASSDNHDHDHM